MGDSSTANGLRASAFGVLSLASGQSAVAGGDLAWANGSNSSAYGHQSYAGGSSSVAMGDRARAEALRELPRRRVLTVDPDDLDGADQRRVDRARADERDADAVWLEGEPQNLGEPPEPELRGAVGRVPRQSQEPRRR